MDLYDLINGFGLFSMGVGGSGMMLSLKDEIINNRRMYDFLKFIRRIRKIK